MQISRDDFVGSVADALQYISCFHPADYIRALSDAYRREESPAARDAIAQLLTNSRMCAEGRRPICQDTGIVVVFLDVGMQVRWDSSDGIEQMVNDAVRRAYRAPDNPLRASMVEDPLGARRNTGDNTPAIVHVRLVPGAQVSVKVAAKGGGSEHKAAFATLNPSDDLVEWVVRTVPSMGAGWCPPGILGIGVGGTAEKAMLLAKESLLEPIDMHELKARGPGSRLEALRIDIYDRVNALGIGAQGLGGLTTVLDVKIRDYPSHAASLPVALIPNCAATRHVQFTLDGTGPATFPVPNPADWPDVTWKPDPSARRIDLDSMSRAEIQTWKSGDRLLLSGTLFTGRDAAHRRIADLLARGTSLPAGLRLADRFIYYVGPVDAVRSEVVGPAGPTTATRMDKFTDIMLERTGLAGMIGKAERGPDAIASIRRHKAVYLTAVGGAAYLIAQAIRAARVVAFPDLGMEAMYELVVKDMPVTVAVDVEGRSIHHEGPALWKQSASHR